MNSIAHRADIFYAVAGVSSSTRYWSFNKFLDMLEVNSYGR